MRSFSWTRWATCALALSLCVPALADGTRRKSLDCTTFDQNDQGDDRVEMTVHNHCTVPLTCSISWRLVCAPDSRKRRSVHSGASQLALVEGATKSTVASATTCGDDGWSIDNIEWSCKPDDN